MRQFPIFIAFAVIVPAPAVLAGDTAPSDYPVFACGTLVQDELYECIVFEPYDGHGPYLLDGWGDFKIGDEVHVSGTATYECITFCEYYACIFGAEVTLCDQGPTGNLDGDGDVDGIDLALLLSQWGTCPKPPAECAADLDDNGAVNGLDLGILLSAWT